MTSASRAVRSAEKEAPLTKTFEQALDELRRAHPETVSFQPAKVAKDAFMGLGKYSVDLTKNGSGMRVECWHLESGGIPEISVETYSGGERIQTLPLKNNPGASNEFLEIFGNKILQAELMHRATLRQALADLPTTVFSIRPLKPSTLAAERFNAPGDPPKLEGTYVSSLRDPANSEVTLEVRMHGDQTAQGKDRCLVSISGKVGNYDLHALRLVRSGSIVDELNLTFDGKDRRGRTIFADSHGDAAGAVIDTLIAKVVAAHN